MLTFGVAMTEVENTYLIDVSSRTPLVHLSQQMPCPHSVCSCSRLVVKADGFVTMIKEP